MSDSAEAIFPDQSAPAEETPVVEQTPTEQAPVIEAASAVETPEQALTPTPAPEATDRHVPITALLDEREKRQAAEREAERLRASIPQEQPRVPDPYEDPQGFEQHVQSRVQAVIKQERLNTSYQIASVRHGREAVEEARVWAIDRAQKDPAFSASLDMQTDPVDWIVHQHKRDGLLSQIGDKSLDDFVKDYVAKDPAKYGLTAPVAATPPSAVTTQPALKAAVPPRSIASDATAPATASDPSADFMAIFKR